MRKDLLNIYIKNHLSVFYLPVFIIGLFLWLRFYLHGYPDQREIISGGILLGISVVFYIVQGFFFKKTLAVRDFKDNSYYSYVLIIIINKIGYMLPWFMVLFWPYQTDYVFDHILGFVFVFLAIGAYVSLSPSCMSLFLSDILLQALAANTILYINRGAIEIPYIFCGLVIFTLYAFLIGRKLNLSARELVEKNHQLTVVAAEARQANMAKSDFLSMISHEIRTPMHGIMSTIEHLYTTRLDDQQKESLQVVTRCSKTLLSMLNDILDLSKIEAKKIVIETLPFNFYNLINDSVDITKFSAEEKNLSLECKIDQGVPEEVKADPVRIQQILLNLLSNAIKFTSKGGVKVHISMVNDVIRVEVADTGIGISKTNQEKLFKRFEQAESSTTRQYGGTGLGLAIAKELAVLMHGDIGVESEEGKGSTFWFEFPYQAPSDDQVDKAQSVVYKIIENSRFLVAEDNQINQKTIERILSYQNCFIDMVENGEAVLEKVQENSYDCILMDMNMPVMNGIEATKKLKESGGSIADIPVIGLTATTEEKLMAEFYDAGIIDHVTKPFSKDDLLGVIVKNIHAEGLEISIADNAASSNAEMEKKLQEICDDFGDEFFRSFIQDSLSEIDRLFDLLEEAFSNKDYKSVYQHAHDICAVSGNIGMGKTYKISKTVEKACLSENFEPVSEHMTELATTLNEEKAEVNKLKSLIKTDI